MYLKMSGVKMSEEKMTGKHAMGKNVRGIDMVCLKREIPRVQKTNI